MATIRLPQHQWRLYDDYMIAPVPVKPHWRIWVKFTGTQIARHVGPTLAQRRADRIHIGSTWGQWSLLSGYICTTKRSKAWTKKKANSGPWFNIKTSSYQYRKSHCGDKTVVRSSYLHTGISYTGKMTSLYWIRALVTWCTLELYPRQKRL